MQSSYQLVEALRRRGLALQFANVMTFREHEKYVQVLFAHLNREPPPNFSRTSASQLIAADKAAWAKVIEQNHKPRPAADGSLALDTAFYRERWSPMRYHSVFSHCHHVQLARVAAALPTTQQSPSSRIAQPFRPDHRMERTTRGRVPMRRVARVRASVPNQGSQTKSEKAGGTANTPDGEPVCFDYSLGRCTASNVPDGARCKKGLHVCCICYAPHAMGDHKKL